MTSSADLLNSLKIDRTAPPPPSRKGLWAGLAVAAGGGLRDAVSALAQSGALGGALTSPAVGYSFVYHLEIGLLFATLVAVGPLVRTAAFPRAPGGQRLGLAEMPG